MTFSFSGSTGDGSSEPLHIAVIRAVAAHRKVDPIELPPLYEWIDPDSLDALFEPTRRNGPRRGRLEFTYDGHAITVDCTDDVTISVDGSPAAESITAGSDRGTPTGA
ncbi:HalOD1 output domain-containing protein [Natrinema sp. DC36]|uniref:HalOD1 output domain-containing protein n=1 Tax=Natrinema sp. DC36 TaxID=2878680 RepID=UPI001CEFD418|nr:HalOD1 output domain-containing protein [Natrinema sp. DC36]